MSITGPADLRDSKWLDEQVADLGRGIEAARAIWSNWFDLRQVGRLHPGMTPGDYIASLGMRLTLPEALAAMPDASPAQVAAVSGVHRTTVVRERDRQGVQMHTVTGADGKSYPRVVREVRAEVIEDAPEPPDASAFVDLMAALRGVGAADADAVLMFVTEPQHRRLRSAARAAARVIQRIDVEMLFVGETSNG